MKTKVKATPIDEGRLDRELKRLFASFPRMHGDPLFGKYKSRFFKQQKRKDDAVFFEEDKNGILSVGKKMEILCTYGNYGIVKIGGNGK